MSIWTSRLTIEPVRPVTSPEMGESSLDQGGYVDLADAPAWWGDTYVRLLVVDPFDGEAEVMLTRDQAARLGAALQSWTSS